MLEQLTCNSCGAPLQVPETANFVTCNHCSTQLAVRRTNDVTFTEQLDRLAEKTEQLSERIDDLSSHTEVATLDREWEFEREKYMVTGRDGSRHIPTEGGSIAGGVMITIFGAFWTAIALGMSSAAPDIGAFSAVKVIFPLFGVLFVIFGIFSSISSFSKADDYRKAEQRYRRRRDDLLQKSRSRST
ncbi:MAG: hypothetical protein RIK87_13310 [Fuerstiella sp.]